MNIDTSTLNANSELMNLSSTAKQIKYSGNTAFDSQLKTLKINESSESSAEDKVSESKAETPSRAEEPKKTENTKAEDKTQKTEQNQENSVNSEEKGQGEQQNSQNSNQNGQNHPAEMLSEEIASMVQQNSKLNGVNGVQNARFVGGISQDAFASAQKINYNVISMSENDAMFFANLVNKTDMSMQSIAAEFQKSLEVATVKNVQKTAQVSSVLMEALSESMKTGKAFRIDFDSDISVVMRVDKDGNLNANFIPGDKAVEAYLRNNISYLKQRFEEQDLPYNELTYSKHKRQDQDEERRNNKENRDE